MDRLVTLIDAADGKADNKIRLTVGTQYIQGLIDDATASGCALEVAHLGEIQKILQDRLQKHAAETKKKHLNAEQVLDLDTYDIPKTGFLRSAAIKYCMSDELKNWYKNHPEDQGCNAQEPTPPAAKRQPARQTGR